MENDKKICLGAIVGVHGIKGEVKVKSFAEKDRNLERYGELEDQNGRRWKVKVAGHSKELLRVKLAGVDDRNTAETLIGLRLYTDRKALPSLESEDEFYQADLIGLAVKDAQNGATAGEVSGVYNFGAGEILEIKIAATGKSEMIPFNRQYVPEVNIKDGYIIVSSVSMIFAEDDGESGAEA